MTNKFILGGVIVALILSLFAVFRGPVKSGSSDFFGAAAGNLLAENYIPYVLYNGGYNSTKSIKTTDDVSTATLTTTGASTLGGTLTVTTSNAATSTASVGCVQTTATSTATAIRLLYTASTTATAISGTQSGFVLWGYGSCPF